MRMRGIKWMLVGKWRQNNKYHDRKETTCSWGGMDNGIIK